MQDKGENNGDMSIKKFAKQSLREESLFIFYIM